MGQVENHLVMLEETAAQIATEQGRITVICFVQPHERMVEGYAPDWSARTRPTLAACEPPKLVALASASSRVPFMRSFF